jgi:NitT/TauT family transport system permease protein
MTRMFTLRGPLPPGVRVGLRVFAFLLIVLGYEFISYRQRLINPTNTTLPSFTQMGQTFVKIVTPDSKGQSWLFEDMKVTFGRHFTGLSIAVVISVFIGVLMGCYRWVEHFFRIPLSVMTRVPATAMIAVFFVMAGTGAPLFIWMIVFGVAPVLTLSIYQAAKYDVHDESINKAYTLGASNAEVIFEVVFKQILPRIIEAIRLQVGPAMVFLLAAEYAVADAGMGYRMKIQSRLTRMDVVYDYIFVLAVVGYLIDVALVWLRNWFSPWFTKEEK